MSPVIAHAADWIGSLVFLAPMLLFGLWFGWEKVQEKRGRRPPEADDADEPSLDDIMDGKA